MICFYLLPDCSASSSDINVVLDLTPNYLGENRWFDNMMTVAEKMKV